MKAKIAIERYDKNHILLERREQPCRSFTINMIKLLYAGAANLNCEVETIAATDITNTSRNLSRYHQSSDHAPDGSLRLAAPGGDGACQILGMGDYRTAYGDNYYYTRQIDGYSIGIVLGTGSGAVAPTDYQVTQIAHGISAGEIQYGGSEVGPLTVSAPSATIDLRRYFTNVSGGDITVNEVGIYTSGAVFIMQGSYLGFTANSFCIARDLVSPAVVVPTTEILRVIYTLSITV